MVFYIHLRVVWFYEQGEMYRIFTSEFSKILLNGSHIMSDNGIYCSMLFSFRLCWHELKTLDYITKLFIFSHNCVVTRNNITAKNNIMLTGFERFF